MIQYAKLYGPIWRVKLKAWLYISLDPVQGAEITSVSSSGNRKAKATCDPYVAVALTVAMQSTGPCFRAMAQMAIDKVPPGPKLDELTAEKVFGGRNVHE